jgi:hypothetical protein
MQTIIQLTSGQISLSIFILIISFGIIQFLSTLWIKARLEKSIQHEYDKKIEDYRFSIIQREQAAKIATFLARWGKYSGRESKILNVKELHDYHEDITRMSYELSLWITDEELLKKIRDRLLNKKQSVSVQQLIIDIRELILGKKNKSLSANDIVYWQT